MHCLLNQALSWIMLLDFDGPVVSLLSHLHEYLRAADEVLEKDEAARNADHPDSGIIWAFSGALKARVVCNQLENCHQ